MGLRICLYIKFPSNAGIAGSEGHILRTTALKKPSQMKSYPGIPFDDLINDLLLIKSHVLVSIPSDPVIDTDVGEFLHLLEASTSTKTLE